MANFPWDIVLWAILALIVGCAVFFVLGRRIGAQAPEKQEPLSLKQVGGKTAAGPGKPVLTPPPLPNQVGPERKATDYDLPAKESSLGQELQQISGVVAGFSADVFLKKAEEIFTHTVKAFAGADRAALAKYLTPSVLAAFEVALTQRAKLGSRMQLELKQIEKLQIVSAQSVEAAPADEAVDSAVCRLGVKITSWQVSYCEDDKAVLIEGTKALTEFQDVWTFECDSDGTWKVSATAVG